MGDFDIGDMSDDDSVLGSDTSSSYEFVPSDEASAGSGRTPGNSSAMPGSSDRPGSRYSPFRGPHLRGSRSRPSPPRMTSPPPPPPIVINPDKELKFESVPATSDVYAPWRIGMKVHILGKYSTKGSQIRKFLQDIEDQDEETLSMYKMTDFEDTLESKLYTGIFEALKSKDHAEFKLELESACTFGRGRQALKKLDWNFQYEGDKLATKHAREMIRTKCEGMPNVSPHAKKFRFSIYVLKVNGTPVQENMALELLKESVNHISELANALEVFDARPIAEKTTKLLLHRLEEKGNEYRTKAAAKKQLGAAAITPKKKVGNGKKCDGCGKTGHEAATCYKLHPELRPAGGRSPSRGDSGAKGKGESKSDAKGKGKKGAFPPCPQCGRTNHPLSKCYFAQNGVVQAEVLDSKGGGSSSSSATATEPEQEAAVAFLSFLKERKKDLGLFSLAMLMTQRQKDESAEFGLPLDVFALDSGCTRAVFNKRTARKFTQKLQELGDSKMYSTAGPVVNQQTALAKVPGCDDDLPSFILDKSPNCAPMGELIENRGFSINWRAGRCLWTDPQGRTVRLEVRYLIPLLKMGLFDEIPLPGEDSNYDMSLAAIDKTSKQKMHDEVRDFAEHWNAFQNVKKTGSDVKQVTNAFPVVKDDRAADILPYVKNEEELNNFVQVGALLAIGKRFTALAGLEADKEVSMEDDENKVADTPDAAVAAAGGEKELPKKAERQQKKKQRRRRRVANKVRYEGAAAKDGTTAVTERPDDDTPIPIEHFYDHRPPHHRCPGCLSKSGKAAIYQIDEDIKVQEQLKLTSYDKGGIDTVVAGVADTSNNHYLMVSRDRGDKMYGVAPFADLQSETTTDTYKELYPGTRYDVDATCFRELYKDGGPEYKGEFEKQLKLDGTKWHLGVPNDSRSDSLQERDNLEVVRGTKASLKTAGAPINFWGSAAPHWAFNANALKDGMADGMTPHWRRHAREPEHQLVPWGCEANVVLGNHDKFGASDTRAIVLGCEEHGAYKIMIFDDYKHERKIVTKITRDVQFDRYVFPFKEIEFSALELDLSTWEEATILDDRLRVETYRDAAGELKCTECFKYVTGLPVTCKKCLDGLTHGRGRRGKNCRLARCYGHPNEVQHMDENEDGSNVPVARPAGSSPIAVTTPRMPVDVAVELGASPPVAAAHPHPEDAAVSETSRIQIDSDMIPHAPMMGAALSKHEEVDPANRPPPGCSQKEAYRQMRGMMTQNETTKRKLEDQVVRVLGLVFRVVDLGSAEAKGPLKEELSLAMDSEWDSLTKLLAFNPSAMIEKDEAIKRHPDAQFAHSRFMCGMKGVEDPVTAFCKARLVVGGHDVRDGENNRVYEVFIHVVPASLLTIRILFFYAGCFVGGVVLTGDVGNAYVKSPLGGRPTYLHPPKQKANPKFRNGVMRLWMALYGLKRSGLDWGTKVRKDMVLVLHFIWVRDIGETSMFMRGLVMAIVATDDFGMAGPEDDTEKAYDEADKHFGFSEKSREQRRQGQMAGLVREVLPAPKGINQYRVHQRRYAQHMIDTYEKEHGITLTPVSTPMKIRRDDVDKKLATMKGYYADRGSEQVGMWFWLTRGTRYDASHGALILSRRVRRWTAEEDAILHRMYRYLKATVDVGIVCVVNVSEIQTKKVKMQGRADADLAGDDDTARSCSSYTVTMCARPMATITVEDVRNNRYTTQALLDFATRGQSSTAFSTPDSEMRALAELIVRALGPLANCFEQVFDGYRMPEEIGTDNAAALIIARSGVSKKLCYLRRTARISIGLVSDYCNAEGCALFKEESASNGSDIGTKSLDHISHWDHMCRLLLY